jgi:sigma-B regulation protein RsbU (phosphoserine phosphatase)
VSLPDCRVDGAATDAARFPPVGANLVNDPEPVARGVSTSEKQTGDAGSSLLFRIGRLLLALTFAASLLLYNIFWMIASQPAAAEAVELGFGGDYLPEEHALLITAVQKNSPAEAAGMMVGDRIVEIDGMRIADQDFQPNEWRRHKPGDTVRLTTRRPGHASPLTLTARFRQREFGRNYLGRFPGRIQGSFQLPFVIVGLAVLFLRIEDPRAWLLALLFASLTTIKSFPDNFLAVPLPLRPIATGFQALFLGVVGPLFYCFFAVFPARSPIDRRLPWLKWFALTIGIAIALPGLRDGILRVPQPFRDLLGFGVSGAIPAWFEVAFLALGLVSLAATFRETSGPGERRKVRVIFWGTLIGFGPGLVDYIIRNFFVPYSMPSWLATILTLLLFLFPLSFAYAVVKHRVLEVPILLKRSARYLLVQRGFTLLLSLLSIGITLIFAFWLAGHFSQETRSAGSSGITLGAIFGTGLLLLGMQVHRKISSRIDRAFFRGAYDARIVLEDLAERMRTVTDRQELADLLSRQVQQALHPSSLSVYLDNADGHLVAMSGEVPEGAGSLPGDLPIMLALARRAKAWDFPREDNSAALAGSGLGLLNPECLVPILGRGSRLLGVLALGPRRSEEPYSGEDRRLLASVASQAGTALENIRMAEEIARRLEEERRAALEMEIAKEVQLRLLPQMPPKLKTLECAAHCIQARSVGGDYYDFIDLGPEETGFVLADVAGKGVHAALLVANLQAHLRSQSAIAPLEIDKMLQRVNGTLWKSTAVQHYATLFFGSYQDSTWRLSYANCGHNPPVWLRSDGTVERLPATATVMGMFEEWETSVKQIDLAPGDLVAIFSDGVTEATGNHEEYGETRLIKVLREHAHGSAEGIVAAVLGDVQAFSMGAQSDDITLLVARCVDL